MIDGTEFDSSYKRNEPATFRANQVIKGWTEALTMMPVGSKWELYIPQELAYGARETGGQIKPFSTLIFEVELRRHRKVSINRRLFSSKVRITRKRGVNKDICFARFFFALSLFFSSFYIEKLK